MKRGNTTSCSKEEGNNGRTEIAAEANCVSDVVPSEIMEIILKEVTGGSIPVCLHVCKLWHQLLKPSLQPTEEMSRPTICLLKRHAFCRKVARRGWLRVLQWACNEMNCFHHEDRWVCANAAKGGHLHVLMWAREQGYNWRHALMQQPAATWQCYNGQGRMVVSGTKGYVNKQPGCKIWMC